MSSGRVEAIWIKRARRGPMDPAPAVELVAGSGIVGKADQGGRRQATVIEREVFHEIRHSLPEAEPFMRRAHFIVSGVRLTGTRSHILRTGKVRVPVGGEMRPAGDASM